MSDRARFHSKDLGELELRHVAARSAHSVIYAARSLADGRPIALKVLRLDGEVSAPNLGYLHEQFLREMAIVRRLDHPSIVRCLDSGLAFPLDGEEQPWIAFEWLDGESLLSALADGARHGPRGCMTLLRPVFDALAFAHRQGVVHRDLKPSNLMLVRGGDASRRVKVLDFGIAKSFDRGTAPTPWFRTTSTHIWFTPRYAAPEQFDERATGPWTDIHALALILVEMLTGAPPYGADANTSALCEARARSRTRPTPGRADLDVGPWEAVIERALALDPHRRYPDVEAFREALERDVPDERVEESDPPPERPRAFRGRGARRPTAENETTGER